MTKFCRSYRLFFVKDLLVPALYCDGFMKTILFSIFVHQEILIYNVFVKLIYKKKNLFPKQGLAIKLKHFVKSHDDSVHRELYTFPATLTAVVRGCVRE